MPDLNIDHDNKLLERIAAGEVRNAFRPLLGNPVKGSSNIDGVKLCSKGVHNVQYLPAVTSPCNALVDLCWMYAPLHWPASLLRKWCHVGVAGRCLSQCYTVGVHVFCVSKAVKLGLAVLLSSIFQA